LLFSYYRRKIQKFKNTWIPAFAGMTTKTQYLVQQPSGSRH
jgi:hypothetical protein